MQPQTNLCILFELFSSMFCRMDSQVNGQPDNKFNDFEADETMWFSDNSKLFQNIR